MKSAMSRPGRRSVSNRRWLPFFSYRSELRTRRWPPPPRRGEAEFTVRHGPSSKAAIGLLRLLPLKGSHSEGGFAENPVDECSGNGIVSVADGNRRPSG